MREPERRPAGSGWVWGNFRFMGQDVWGWKRSAIAIEAAEAAETVQLGSVHESAGPQDIAQTPPQSPIS